MVRKKIALIGGQCGDEGKGKIVSHYVKSALSKVSEEFIGYSEGRMPIVVHRWQGGANAGHTIVVDDNVYKLHQLPSGIVFPNTYNLVGQGTYFNPRKGMEEIEKLLKQGISVSEDNLGIASNVHVTFDYHIDDDKNYFDKRDHTSTGSGIKQTAVDKYDRNGLRFEEFLDRNAFLDFLKKRNCMVYCEEFVESYSREREFFSNFSVLENNVLKNNAKCFYIAEGAQGVFLDVDAGLYPGVTSSNPAIPPNRPDEILGIFKLYTSSVGKDRPFVSQIEDRKLENYLRREFGEIGTTTGKPRDLGWFDCVAAKYAIEKTGADFLVCTCGDRLEVLDKIGEKIKLVVGYEIDGREYFEWDKSFHNRNVLYDAKPIYEEFEPWNKFVDDEGKLTKNANKYLEAIENNLDKGIVLLGTGPGEKDVVEYLDVLMNRPLFS